MKLFVGNLSFDTREAELEELFAPFGTVAEATVITDQSTGRSRGFAFVTLKSAAEAQAAIRGLAGKNFSGRNLTVNEAKPREERPLRSFSGSSLN
jgi:cold-inducible RNA-binding protein